MTQRSSRGAKLGAIIGCDLEKRATKEVKDAAKPSKRPKGIKTEHHETVKLDIRVPDKDLTDDGLHKLTDGLETALSTCQHLSLVDLNIAGNSLTTRSLLRLAPLIRRARFNLQTLNLANNNIVVATDEQAREWETFLKAFSECRTLRLLDLSDNTRLGSRGLEILARIYLRESPIDPVEAWDVQSVLSLPDTVASRPEGAVDELLDASDEDEDTDMMESTCGKNLSKGGYLAYRCGLRSIPYMTVRNIGLTDGGALFLSFVLERHYYPIQLITAVNAPESSSRVRLYQQESKSSGLDWDQNDATLGKDGMLLLQHTQVARRDLMGDADSMHSSVWTIASELTMADADEKEDRASRKAALTVPTRRMLSQEGSRRRTSMRSNMSTEDGPSDVEHARRKIQRTVIMQYGYRSVEIWRAGMAVLAFSRKLGLLLPTRRRDSHATPIQDGTENNSISSSDLDQKLESLSLVATSTPGPTPDLRPSPSPSRITSIRIIDITNLPSKSLQSNSSMKVFKTRSIETAKADSDETAATNIVHRSEPPQISNKTNRSTAYIEWQQKLMQTQQLVHGGASDGYRDKSLRCNLPLSVCLRCLEYGVDESSLSLLTERQRKKAFEWGHLEDSLKTGYGWRNKDKASQIWMLLEALECLAYER